MEGKTGWKWSVQYLWLSEGWILWQLRCPGWPPWDPGTAPIPKVAKIPKPLNLTLFKALSLRVQHLRGGGIHFWAASGTKTPNPPSISGISCSQIGNQGVEPRNILPNPASAFGRCHSCLSSSLRCAHVFLSAWKGRQTNCSTKCSLFV